MTLLSSHVFNRFCSTSELTAGVWVRVRSLLLLRQGPLAHPQSLGQTGAPSHASNNHKRAALRRLRAYRACPVLVVPGPVPGGACLPALLRRMPPCSAAGRCDEPLQRRSARRALPTAETWPVRAFERHGQDPTKSRNASLTVEPALRKTAHFA